MECMFKVIYEELTSNICKLSFTLMTLFIVVLGVFINLWEKYVPVSISRTYRYGKYANQQESLLVQYMEVPKSYFKHFYATAALLFYPLVFNEVFAVYLCGWDPEDWFVNILDYFGGAERKATAPLTRAGIAVSLVLFQLYRRFYDTHFVSVFSPEAKMNIGHYIVGMIYYPLVMLTILIEAPLFAQTDFDTKLSFDEIRIIDWISIIVFFWSWYHQHTTTVILANLRKNKKGTIVSSSYKIPQGDWFEYLSQPHDAAEILMYICIAVIIPNNTGWWFVLAWVISNRAEAMVLSHWWYKSTFDDYPKNRKALIPFVY